ncbi:cell wall elongation regulator TseB-like domain-containing protein [Vagococcus sp. JNUCC 83]
MRENKLIKYLTITLITILVVISAIFYRSTSTYRSTKRQAVAIAKNLGHINKVDEFYWFTRQENTYSVVGRDDNNQEKIVMIPENGKGALVIYADKGVKQDDAIQTVLKTNETKMIKKVSLGLVDEKPVWEITAKSKDDHLVYYLVDFYSGEIKNGALKI